VDVLSHSAVRARNGGVVMATCFDGPTIDQLASMSGQTVAVTVAQVCKADERHRENGCHIMRVCSEVH